MRLKFGISIVPIGRPDKTSLAKCCSRGYLSLVAIVPNSHTTPSRHTKTCLQYSSLFVRQTVGYPAVWSFPGTSYRLQNLMHNCRSFISHLRKLSTFCAPPMLGARASCHWTSVAIPMRIYARFNCFKIPPFLIFHEEMLCQFESI